ncbi:ribosomal L28 family-domain-containing protein [Achaetomium macrosporum]|uniref:Large ribosomal subunit protein bL28m n=1 Tax=Achaetomium macrosporum TaxID=79813 RepID=A0AAN7C811_9PEZI|nr:ribosomal L28 family-domain-containing protein [Achaetomium macrosporum]
MPPTLPIQTCLRASASASAAAARPSTALPRIFSTRTLSTTSPALYKQPSIPGSDLPIPSVSAPHPEIPPYPYGPRPFYHQSNTGLYGEARIRFGNNVSEENEVKTRRKWRPNVHHKRLWSASLGVFVKTRVTTRVLRTIDKVGGLDEYLLGRKPQRVKDLGPWGWRLRWRIMQTPAVRERFAKERAALGLPPKEETQLRAEAEADLPDGSPAGDALMAETDRMLEEGSEFELGAEEEGGFMREEKPSRT